MPLPLRAYARTPSGYVQERRKQLLKTSVCRYTRVKHRQGTKSGMAHMKLADSAGKLKTIGFGHMLMLWDGNVSNVLFVAGSEAVLSSE